MTEQSCDLPLHPLQDRWFVYYNHAAKEGDAAWTELDYVSTMEEAFATLNVLPHITLLPADDSIFFSREKKLPKFESYTKGVRFSVFPRTKVQCSDSAVRTLAAVLGEELSTKICKGEKYADVVRISHKPHWQYSEATLVEVWAHGSAFDKDIEQYFNQLLKSIPGIQVKFRPM